MRDEATTSASSLLVLADVKWTTWRAKHYRPGNGDPWERHATLLRSLLCRDDDSPVDGWLLHNPTAGVDTLVDAARAPEAAAARRLLAGADPSTWYGLPKSWLTGQEAEGLLRRLEDGLHRCDELLDARVVTDTALMTGLLNQFACRVHLEPCQLDRVAVPHAAPGADWPIGDAFACIDFRFHFQVNTYWLYAYLSVWSAPPASSAHSPSPNRAGGRGLGAARPDLASLPSAYAKTLSDRFSQHCLYRMFPPVDITVAGEEHRPPRFWVLAGADAVAAFDAAPSDPARQRHLDAFCTHLLFATSTSTGVADGMLATRLGRARVLRRFLPEENAPAFLVVPDPALPRDVQEDIVRALVFALTDVETGAAAALFDLTTDLEIGDCLVRVYDTVELRASVLWDQLATFLPDTHGSADLDHVYGRIQLIHLVLLQGIADLDWVHSEIQAATGRVTQQAIGVGERFDRLLTEEPRGATAVREGMRTSGYVDATSRTAASIGANAMRVRAAYQSLIDGIGDAYDDRRFRDTDRMGITALWVAVGLAFVGLVTESFDKVLDWWGLQGVENLYLFLGLLIVFGTGAVLLYRRQFKPRGDVSFSVEPEYRQLRAFLLNCRTDRLHRLREQGMREVDARIGDWRHTAGSADEARHRRRNDLRTAWNEYYTYWADIDEALSRELAALIDRLLGNGMADGPPTATPVRRRATDRDRRLHELQQDIERWALFGMLTSERPTSFYRFPLPRLMMLYRFYPIARDEFRASNGDGSVLVSESDLFISLRVHCTAQREHIRTVRDWSVNVIGDQSRPVAAGTFLAHIERLGIRAGMDNAAWVEAVELMRRPAVGG